MPDQPFEDDQERFLRSLLLSNRLVDTDRLASLVNEQQAALAQGETLRLPQLLLRHGLIDGGTAIQSRCQPDRDGGSWG